MTKITTYNRGIIIDGHADTKEECETITLLCNSLAKDENFKQVAYDDGYAAFQKVGKAERLRFAPIPQNNLTITFDTGIQSVDFSYGSNTHTFTTSGELYGFTAEPGSDITLTVNLKSGYNLKSSSKGTVSGNTVTIPFSTVTSPTNLDCTLVSEAASSKLSVDLTTLSGWSNLSSGSHTIKIVAKGTGYRDSEKSAGVSVTKAAEVYTDCLTFTGESSEFTLKATNQQWDGTLEWSTDHNTWTTLTSTEEMQSVGKKLYLRGKGNTGFYASYSGIKWVLSAKAGCSGNIQTLLDWENPPTVISPENCYYEMFAECANLTTAPELPATTLSNRCYYYMFENCTNLTSAPELPATTLADYCYNTMFRGCTNLISAPELPATTLTDSCYNAMFYGCTSLVNIPNLPAVTLAKKCYSNMFGNCTSLTSAPKLPATILANECYHYMFQGCTSLKVNTTSGTKIFTCPSSIPSAAVADMFTNTGGSFKGTPTAGNTYYWTE